jgi:hypothetical protein
VLAVDRVHGGIRPRGRRLCHSTVGADGAVEQSPVALWEQAKSIVAGLTLEEFTGARLIASEYGSGNFIEWSCLLDAELNRAAHDRLSLYDSLTRGHGFGEQGRPSRKPRPASTRADPHAGHAMAARAVLHGGGRGVSQGAVRFFDPDAMESLHAKYLAWKAGHGPRPRAIVTCSALDLLERWSFGFANGPGGSACPFDRSRPGHFSTEAWVGPIEGVDAAYLMLMRPFELGPGHTALYVGAKHVIEEHLQSMRRVSA